MKRRAFLLSTLAGLSATPLLTQRSTWAKSQGQPFSLGVASGDITDTALVLWTRLAPEPSRADGGMDPVGVPVHWELATDPDLSRVVQRGEMWATPELAHSIHVDVQGLEPGQTYWYQFSNGGTRSTIGRTNTLPIPGQRPVRFVTASCQNYTHGYFVAYEHIVDDRPDFVIHLGDYIYDTSFGETVRKHDAETAPVTLDDFRRRHALYKTDRHLQHAHSQVPFFTTIDNHDAIEDRDPDKFAQRAAAYQAWYEHMPIRGYGGIGKNSFDLIREIDIGDLMRISLLDARQFRDKRDLCGGGPSLGFGNYRPRCQELLADERSMLGAGQEQWLLERLTKNQAAWNVIASPGPFLPFRFHHEGETLSYIGAWDGYPANRARIATGLEGSETGHPVVVSGDVHSFWAVDGARMTLPEERIPVVEFVASSINSNWPGPMAEPITDNLDRNPQVEFYEPNKRGYFLHEVSETGWLATARAVVDVTDEHSTAQDAAAFRINHGEAGFTRIR